MRNEEKTYVEIMLKKVLGLGPGLFGFWIRILFRLPRPRFSRVARECSDGFASRGVARALLRQVVEMIAGPSQKSVDRFGLGLCAVLLKKMQLSLR